MIEIKICYKRGYPARHKVAFSVTDIYNISKALMNLNRLKDTADYAIYKPELPWKTAFYYNSCLVNAQTHLAFHSDTLFGPRQCLHIPKLLLQPQEKQTTHRVSDAEHVYTSVLGKRAWILQSMYIGWAYKSNIVSDEVKSTMNELLVSVTFYGNLSDMCLGR